MKRLVNKLIFSRKTFAILMMVFLVGTSFPISAFAALAVDVTADGQNSLTLASASDSFDIELTATDAVACQITAPGPLAGNSISPGGSIAVSPGDAAYPSAGGSVTFTISCLDAASASLSDSVTVSLGAAPALMPTIDVEANGSDGPITINSGDIFSYTWTSTNSTACQQTPPDPVTGSGISLAGTSAAIGSGHAFYPSVGSPTTITITCTDGTNSATDSVVINLAAGPVASTTPTVDIEANGSDGPITLNSGDTFTYSWVSTNSTACQQTPPDPVTGSGISLNGTSAVIGSGHAFYPSIGSPTTLTIVCTDGVNSATDSVVINLAGSTPPPTPGTNPTVDVKANGSDGPVTLNQGDTYTYTWVSANATACQQTPPDPVTGSGIALTGTSAVIDPSHPFYPTISSPTTITIVCTDGVNSATDAVIINLADDDDNGGGGGGGGGGRRNRRAAQGEVLAGSTECPWIRDYMRADFANDSFEVMKLQAFLRTFMGYEYVTVNGVFDQATYTAVGQFQMQYKDEILTPWGHTAPTHYVYILTLKKINEIYCQQIMPLTSEQQSEIITFRNLVNTQPAASPAGVPELPESGVGPSGEVGAATTTPVDKGQNMQGLAAALFTFPDNLKDTMQCLYEYVLVAVVLYILGTILKDVLYKNVPENSLKRFLAKWVTISIGLLAALVAAYSLGELCLVLPLMATTIFSVIWMAFYPKHESIRSMTKSWVIYRKEEKKA